MPYYVLTNGLLLAGLAWWLRRAWRTAPPALRSWLLPAVVWRLLVTATVACWPGSDAQHANQQAGFVATRLLAAPGQALAQLQQARFYASATDAGTEVYRWSQTVFFDKLVALLSVFSGGALWVNALYASLLCLVASWALVRAVSQELPRAAPAAGAAFLLWPTVLWWTAGVNKETALVTAGAGVLALVLPLLYGPAGCPRPGGWQLAGRLLALLLLAWLMTRIRYFFALPLLGGLLALAGVQLATRRGWLSPRWPAQVGGLLVALLLLLALAKTLGGRLMEVDYFVQEVDLNYQHGLAASVGKPHVEYAHWQASATRLLTYAPQAVLHTLGRPWLGESANWLYIGAGLENLLLLVLLARAGWALLRGRPGPLPVALAAMLLLYCLLLAAFIGLSTPNLGTLSRYRSVLLPWLLWLALVKWRNGEV